MSDIYNFAPKLSLLSGTSALGDAKIIRVDEDGCVITSTEKGEITRLRAENEHLRMALEEARDYFADLNPTKELMRVDEIARKAPDGETK